LGGRSVGSEVKATRYRNVVNGETLPISRLIELAADLGLKAEHTELDWQRLQSLGFAHPLLVLLKSSNVILLTGSGRDGVSEVAIWDPGNLYGEILSIPREDFERVSTGHALIITMPPSNGAETLPSSDFCWFTSAGLELLAKTSARGKNPKRLIEGREEPRSKSARQTDRATTSDARAQPLVAPVELASMQPPLNLAEGAQLLVRAPSRAAAGRGLSPFVRLCIAVGVILAAAGGGTFLINSSVTGAVAAVIAFAKDVWVVAPNGAPSTDDRVERVPRTGAIAIPTVLPVTPAEPKVASPAVTPAEPGISTPPIEPIAPRTERTTRRPAPRPVLLIGDPDLGVTPVIPATVPETTVARATPATVPEAIAPSSTFRPSLGAAAAAPDAQKAASPPPVADPRLSTEEMAVLLARGDSLLSVGDIASARLFYERVADAGGGIAAIRLGETFDRFFLDRVHLRSVRGDRGAALFWYRRARDLGATDAEVLVKALETK
jgi:hypothetical protein